MIQRYQEGLEVLEPDEEGSLVLYEDHIANLESLRAENAVLREALSEIQLLIEGIGCLDDVYEIESVAETALTATQPEGEG